MTFRDQEQVDTGLTFDQLINTPVMPEHWVIDGLIPSGCSLLSGTIKIGKSALAEWAACVLGNDKRIAYFALEYCQNVLVKRFKALHDRGLRPSKIQFWHKYHIKDSLMEPIDFFKKQINRYQPEIIIVDTMTAIKTETKGDYQKEWKDVMQIRDAADTIGADLILLHHSRKENKDSESEPRERFLGSQGIGATVDNLIFYDRPDNSTRVQGFGRNVDDFETFLTFDQGLFTIENPNEIRLQLLAREAPAQHSVLKALNGGPLLHGDILQRVNANLSPDSQMSATRLYQILKLLTERELIKQSGTRGGHWHSLLAPLPP